MERKQPDMQALLQQYKQIIAENIEVELYRNDCYDIPFCLAVFYSEDNAYLASFEKHIRMTDGYFALGDNLACIIFAHSDMDGAFKACQNIISDYGYLHPEKRVYAGLSAAERFATDHELVSRAFHALSYARSFPESTVENDMTLFCKL